MSLDQKLYGFYSEELSQENVEKLMKNYRKTYII